VALLPDSFGDLYLNEGMRENLFCIFTAIENKIPLMMVGVPGSGKSLSQNLMLNMFDGSVNLRLKVSDVVVIKRHFQGSRSTTAQSL
jgi:hypothetical protein